MARATAGLARLGLVGGVGLSPTTARATRGCRSYEHCWPLFEGYGGRLAGRSEGMDDLEGAVTARIEEDGRLIVSCNEPGCEHQFELRPLHLPQDTGSLADAVNAGWQISSDEATPDFCPQHSGTSA